MKPATVMGGILFAAVIALGSIPLRVVLNSVLSLSLAMKLAVIIIAVVYCLWLLSSRAKRVGTVSAGIILCAIFGAALVFNWSFVAIVWLSVASSWLIRSVTRYQSFAMAGVDGACTIVALICATSVLEVTRNPTMCIWSYFLIIAITALLPVKIAQESRIIRPTAQLNPFDQAFATADGALREIIKRQTA